MVGVKPTTPEPRVNATALVRPDGRTTYAAELTGRLPVFWAGNLTAALAARNIAIVSGRGTSENRKWAAALVLDARGATAAPDKLDLIELANTESPPADGPPLALTRFACDTLTDGRLEVRVSAPDQPAFLSRLLRSMALVSLFLREFEIDTPNGTIRDRFVLSGVGGAVSPTSQQAFEKILRGYTG